MRHKYSQIVLLILIQSMFLNCQSGAVRPQNDQKFTAASSLAVVPGIGSANAAAWYYFICAQIKMKDGEPAEARFFLENALQYDPQSVILKLELANIYQLQDNSQKALNLINEVLKDHPDHVEALVAAGQIYQAQQDYEKAKSCFEKALIKAPDNPNMYLQLGRIYWNENDLNNADRIFHAMVTHFPTSYAAYYFDGKVLSAQGKYDQAAQAFKQSLILEPSLEEPRFELIKIYQIQNKPADVTKTYQDLLDYNPDNFKAAIELAVYYLQTSQNEESLSVLTELGQRADDETGILSYVFEAYIEPKKYEIAAWLVEGMLQGDPPNSDLHYLAGVIYDGSQQPEKALTHLQQVKPQSRFYENAVIQKALLLNNAGEIEKAIKVINQAIASRPEHADYYLYLGSFYEALERYPDAVAALEKGAALDVKNTRIQFRLGVIYDKIGQRDKGIDAMKQVIQLQPEDAEALNYLGYTYADLGINLNEAEALVQSALKIKPEDGYIRDSMAWVYYKQGRYEDALVWLKKAIDIVPQDPTILEHLGDVYLKLNSKDKALESYRRSLELQTKGREQVERKIKILNASP